MKKEMKIGLVLGGGGVRGAAHAGLLKVLEEEGIKVHAMSGSSAGALVGALYAAGYSPEEIRTFFKENANVFRWQNFSTRKPGILDADRYATIFEPWLNGHTFETLNKKLHICVTDILEGKAEFISEGELVRPILASAAIPGLFSPVDLDRKWYVDGGTMNNFPVEPLLDECDIVIGSHVSGLKKLTKRELNSSLRLMNRATELSFYAGSMIKFRLCHHVFKPDELADFSVFDVKFVDKIFEIGYQHARENIQSLKSAISEFNSMKNIESKNAQNTKVRNLYDDDLLLEDTV